VARRLPIFLALLQVPARARAEIEITLKSAFIEKFKDRATIEATGSSGATRARLPGAAGFPSCSGALWGSLVAREGTPSMTGRDIISLLVGLMVAGVLVWSVTAWVFTGTATFVSGTLVGLIMGGLMLWGFGWLLDTHGPSPPPGTRRAGVR